MAGLWNAKAMAMQELAGQSAVLHPGFPRTGLQSVRPGFAGRIRQVCAPGVLDLQFSCGRFNTGMSLMNGCQKILIGILNLSRVPLTRGALV